MDHAYHKRPPGQTLRMAMVAMAGPVGAALAAVGVGVQVGRAVAMAVDVEMNPVTP